MAMNQQMPDITQVLVAAGSQDGSQRKPAEKILEQLEQQQLDKYLAMLALEMANVEKPESVRQLAGLLLKNTVSSKDPRGQAIRNERWLTMSVDSRQKIRDTVLSLLATPSKLARDTAAIVIAKIAAVEIPAGQWGNLVGILVENTKKAQDDAIRESLFKCLSYVAEEVNKDSLIQYATDMLNAMSEGMKSDHPLVRYAATNCLGSSLEIIRENIFKPEHRKLILQMVYQGAIYGTQDANPNPQLGEKVRMASFSVLIQVAWHYYELLDTEIEDIFRLTLQAIQKDTEQVKLRAIEFWSTVAETEGEIVVELQDAQESGRPADRQLKNFVNKAAQHLAPALLQCLTVREEGAGEEWNQSSAAGTCLGLISEAIRDLVVQTVLPFVRENLRSPKWNMREAAILAFGYILSGPSKDKMCPLVEQALPLILEHVRDKNSEVKDTAAWTIGRICDLVPQAVGKDSLKSLMLTTVDALKSEPRVAAKMCWAIHNLADAVPKGEPSSPLSDYFEGLAGALLQAAAREDSDEANLLPSAYEALNLLIQTSGDDVQGIVEKLIPTIVERISKTKQQGLLNERDLAKENDLRALLIGSLASIVQRLPREKIQGQARQLLEIFLAMLQTQNIVLHEEVLMAVGAMAQKLGGDFQPFFKPFKPFIINALGFYQSHEIVQVAVGVIGDVCRALESRVEEHCDDLVRVLLASLQKQELDRTVKPHIINCLGDIALAIGRTFERYLSYVMVMFIQASHVTFEKPDHTESEYLGNLRESILEAYTAIVQGLDSGGAASKFDDYVNSVVDLIALLMTEGCRDPGVLAAACGCVGDIVSCMGSKVITRFQSPKVQELLRVSQEIKVEKLQNNVTWAMEALSS